MFFKNITYLSVLGTCFANFEILKLNSNISEMHCSSAFKEISFKKEIDYFIVDRNSSIDYLEDCLLRRRNVDKTITLLSPRSLYVNPKNLDVHADVLIYISDLNPDIFNESIYKFQNSPKHLIIFIIVTTKSLSLICNNGVFQENAYKAIEFFFNILWHKYEMYFVIMEFPFVCPGYYVIFQGKKQSGLAVYNRGIMTVPANLTEDLKTKLMADKRTLSIGYPLRANIFERFSTAIANCTNMHYYWKSEDEWLTEGWCGVDVLVMHDILLKFKFKVEFPGVKNDEGFGFVNSYTGAATGSIGYLLNDVIDISFNARFMIQYVESDAIKFPHYVSTDSMCVVMKDPSVMPLWHYAFNTFTPISWISLVISFAALGLAAKVVLMLRRRLFGEEDWHTYTIILFFISMGFTGSYFHKKMPASILGGLCLLISVTMISYYQGNVNYMHTNYLNLHKIERLTELRDHNIPIYSSVNILNTLGVMDNRVPFVVGSVNKSDPQSFDNIGVLGRKLDVSLQILRDFTDKNGRPMYYIVDECYANYFLSYIVRKDFPFVIDLQYYIMMLNEAGLPEVYARWTQNAFHLTTPPIRIRSNMRDLRPATPTTLMEHRIAFGFLLAGYTVSTVVFVLEIWWARKKSQILAMHE